MRESQRMGTFADYLAESDDARRERDRKVAEAKDRLEAALADANTVYDLALFLQHKDADLMRSLAYDAYNAAVKAADDAYHGYARERFRAYVRGALTAVEA